MNIGQQLLHGLVKAPGVIFRMPGKAWGFFLLYLTLGAALLGGVAALLVVGEADIKQAALSYLFPEEWHAAAEILIQHFLASQQKDVLINALVIGTLSVVSLLLFWVKEAMSRRIETGLDLREGRAFEEHPLWFEVLEEIKLLVITLTVLMATFWIGYHPDPWRKVVASVLSYGFLFFLWAVDFGAPLMQRHRVRYSQIYKAIFRAPVASFGFGALFALPPVLAGHLVTTHPGWPMGLVVGVLFGVELVAMIWAAAAGTHLGAQLLPIAERSSRSHIAVAAVAYLLLFGGFGASVYVFANLGVAVNHKSQVLKCTYSVDMDSFGIETPDLDSLLGSGGLGVAGYFDLEITNPTGVDVEIEDNRLEITSGETVVATTKIAPMKVPAHETVTERVKLTLELKPTALLKGARLLSDELKITFYLAITDDIEFPIYLVN